MSSPLLTAKELHELFKKDTPIHVKFRVAFKHDPQVMDFFHVMYRYLHVDQGEKFNKKGKKTNHLNVDECYLFFVLWVIGSRLLMPEKATIEEAMDFFCEYMAQSDALSIPSGLMSHFSTELWSVLQEIDKLASRFQLAKNQDLFHVLYQDLMLPTVKKKLGAYFTPPSLAQLMIKEVITSSRQSILDPACGTGVFLIEAFSYQFQLSEQKDVDAALNIIQNIQGFDLHPNAVLATTINLMVQLKDLVDDLSLVPHFMRQRDALCLCNAPKISDLSLHSFDVVVGNPPWKVLNSFKSKKAKEKLKQLAKKWNVLPPSHQVSHLEISGLFLEAAKRWYLRPEGQLFLVVSHSLLTGDNHSKTRRFDELEDVEIWTFQDRIFSIPFCCVKARYRPGKFRSRQELTKLRINVIQHESVEKSLQHQERGLAWKKHQWVPAFVDQNSSGTLVGRYVPLDERRALLQRGRNPYHPRCFAGATLFPRNLLFVSIVRELDDETALVVPMIRNAKKPWHFNPMKGIGAEHVVIERKYIFPVMTSQEILPFTTLSPKLAFLPIEREDQGNGYRKMSDKSTRAWKYYLHLEDLYARHRKSGAMFTSLWDRLNYQQCLTNPRQHAKIRVLMPQSGQLLKAAVLEDSNVIVDYTSYLIPCDNLKEAHYLTGILNSPLMKETIKMIKADRHIQKRPLEFSFPRYDPNNPNHEEIVKLSEKMHAAIQQFVNDTLEKDASMGRVTLQRRILKKFEEDFILLSTAVSALFEIKK